jgi:hypothetical protein
MNNGNLWGFGAMATPNLDPGDIGYVSPAQATYDSSHDAGDLTFAQSLTTEQKQAVGIGAIALVAIGAWLLLKR